MIEYLWPTPVLTTQSPFSQAQLVELLEYSKIKSAEVKASSPQHRLPDIETKLTLHFNLFDALPDINAPQVWQDFRKYVDKLYRDYLCEAHKVYNTEELDIVARCIYGSQQNGERTAPHYHHTCDHVLCLYLDCGEDRPERGKQTREKGDGELVLQDPRAMGSFPFWQKTRYMYTEPGTVILHPSRLWHETNPFNAIGTRSLLTVTLRVASHNYSDIYVNI